MNFCRHIKCDNEPSIKSETIKSLLNNQYDIQIVNAPPLHSTSNGQVERFHSTLGDIARCLAAQRRITDTVETILQAPIEYNTTVHSVTGKRPIDIIHSSSPELKTEVGNKVRKAQQFQMNRVNGTRHNRQFQVGDTVLVRANRRLGNKLTPLYKENTIEADLGTTVLIKGRVVHKDNLR